ncbi:hypothetical protein MIZ01_1133 [Sideroxyarcus emersonii]|uniref:Uncharacterized protein n=1 Tax=Sideroxyarcus emersonii TaxID=2764705 RepID=A0AAN2BYN9_9PROT|nr:hypothetical protein [Sideroxyarcus emersonii]BCK87355.1 hypothetical protein MIZ01_1133 [Sideroxyarcus emersonii]
MSKENWTYILWSWIALWIFVTFNYFVLHFPFSFVSTKDIFNTAVGGLIAFGFNLVLHDRKETKENLAAGLAALFTIRSQFDDYLNCRLGIYNSIATTKSAQIPGAPDWSFVKPLGFNFNPSNVFDFKSIDFLLTSPSGKDVYQHLQLLERTYLDLMARYNDLNGSAIELQKTMSGIIQIKFNYQHPSFQTMEYEIGPELIGRVISQQHSVIVRLVRDEARYSKIFGMLQNELLTRFGVEVIGNNVHEIPVAYRKSNLPKLPQSLASIV